jgi:hypothetical protein
MKHFLKKSALAAAVLAGLGSAHAATLTFEDPVDFPLFWNGDVFSQQGFELAPQNLSGDDSGFVGAIVNGADPGTCATVSCPTNNATNYYSSVNDGILRLRMDNGAAFRLNSFDASFLGASGETLPAVSGLLRIEFDRADGTYVLMQYLLNGPATSASPPSMPPQAPRWAARAPTPATSRRPSSTATPAPAPAAAAPSPTTAPSSRSTTST